MRLSRASTAVASAELPQTSVAAVSTPRLYAADIPKDLVKEAEIYHEELDQELFSIFLKQLTEEMLNLSVLIQRAKTVDVPGAVLLDCVTSLEKLKSSANYMGYEQLIELYDAWIRTIYESLGEDVPNWDTVEGYFGNIVQKFPELGPTLLEGKTAANAAAQPQPTTAPPKAASLPPVVTVPKAMPPVLHTPAPPPAISGPAAADALLAQLSAALGQVAAQAPVPTAAADLGVAFEELTEVVDEYGEPIAAMAPALEGQTAEPEEDIVQDDSIDDIAYSTTAIGTAQPALGITGDSKKKPAAPSPERALKRSVRVDAEKIDTLMNQVGELIVHRSYFNQIHNELISIQRRLEELGIDSHQAKALRTLSYRYSEAIVSLSRTANELQEGVMKVRMLPIAQLFNRYPRLVHDLVRHSEKKVRLEMQGEDTELDKMIIEEVSDPLIHIIRNAIDHGFETAAERKRLGKPEIGTLVLDAYHESNHIVIKVTDDGRGIDPQKVAAKAIEKGLITEAELERMTPREIMRLIMQPGFSTAEAITSTSGRGVGMDVVRKNIEKLNGSVEIDSDVGHGTRFRLKIPLTLAIISALQVRVGDTHFTVPLANVEETLRVFDKETSTIEGVEVVQLRGHTMPIFRLSSIFGIDGDDRSSGRFFVVVVNTGNEKVGLVVDQLLGQDEVVIKPLIDYLQEKSGFSGATIIGGGRISLILDVYELVKLTAYKQARIQHQFAARRRQLNQAHAFQ